MGVWAAIASLYGTCSSCYRILGAKISWKTQGLLHSMRRPGWERWWIGEANCPFTIKRSLDWNAMDELLGKLLPFKLRKMEMMRLAQGTHAFWMFASQNAIRTTSSTLNGLNPGARFVHCEGPADKIGRTYRRQKHWKNDVNKGQRFNSQVLEKQKISTVLWWNWHL